MKKKKPDKKSSGDEIANVNFYTVCQEDSRIRWNNAIMPFKVTDFGTNQKLIYDFLLVINTNLPPIYLHCLPYLPLNLPPLFPRYCCR